MSPTDRVGGRLSDINGRHSSPGNRNQGFYPAHTSVALSVDTNVSMLIGSYMTNKYRVEDKVIAAADTDVRTSMQPLLLVSSATFDVKLFWDLHRYAHALSILHTIGT